MPETVAAADQPPRAATERLREVLDGMGEGFLVLDRELRVVEINAEGVRVDGRSRDEIVGRHLLEVWPEAERLPTLPAYRRALETGEPVSLEYRHVSDVHDVWLEVRAYHVPDGLAVFYRDVSERHRAVEALQSSDEFLRRVLESSADCIKVLSLDGRLEFMSETGMCVMEVDDFGAVVGAYWPGFWEGEERAKAEAALERARAGGAGRFRGFARTAKGSPRWWDVAVTPIRGADGRPDKLLSVSRDVTDLREHKAALDESEGRLSAVLDALPVGVIIADARGRVLRDNAANRELWGVPPETENVDQYDAWVGYWPETGERLRAEDWAMARAILHGETVRGELVEAQRFDTAERRLFLNNAAPVRDADGRIVGGVVAELDVTDRLATERALRGSEARLRLFDALGRATADLADADAILAATTRLVGEHMDVASCAYADMDEDGDGFTIRGDWAAPGGGSIVGRYSLAAFGRLAVAELNAGRPLVVADNRAELAPEEAETFQAIGIAATICVPLIKNGRLTALMAVHDRVPRRWTDAEVATTREVAERCWAHIQRVGIAAALGESEARFRNMADHAPVIVWTTDPTGYCTYLNRQWYEFTGQSREEAEGFGWLDATHPEHQEEAGRIFLEANAAQAPFRLEYRLRRADGSYRWAIDAASPRFGPGGEFLGFIGSVFDIDERREAEERLRESEERYRTLFENIDAGFCIVEMKFDEAGRAVDYRMTDVNPAFERQTGLADAVGRWVSEAVPGLERHWFDTYGHVALTGEPARFENEAVPFGRWYDVHAFRTGRPEERRVAILFNDISDRRLAETRLRELNQTLERRVADEVAERARAEEALRQAQKLEAVGQLTGGIAHDFNNLLTVVVGNIDMGLRALDAAGGDARVRRALGSAQKGAERAAALTQRLLAFSRRQPLAPKQVDVDRLVAGMSDLLNRSLGETVELEIATAPGLWRVEADPNQLESAILNLAINARDAMPQGGTLTIETANARLDEAYTSTQAEVAPGQYVVIAVTDTGHGMPRELLDKVFEPFFTTKEVGKGTGLGLSMVYGFVKQSGGHVKIYSEEGRGTSVKLYLPRLLTEAAEEEAVLTPGLEMSRRAETVLVVEDDDDVRAYTVECLRELGYRVLEAHDGASALRLLERQGEGVDLLFTDVVMPSMSGSELADAARERRPDLRVLYTSGYTRNAIMHGGRLDPGVEMIAKPFTFQALAQKVRDMLDAGATRRVLVAQADPTVRALSAEALAGAGYAADEAATAAELLGRVRAAQGRYDAVVLDAELPDKAGDATIAELRALYAELPVLVAAENGAEGALRERLGADRFAAVVAKPFTGAALAGALREMGVGGR